MSCQQGGREINNVELELVAGDRGLVLQDDKVARTPARILGVNYRDGLRTWRKVGVSKETANTSCSNGCIE